MIIDPILHQVIDVDDYINSLNRTADNFNQVLFTDANTKYIVLSLEIVKDIKLIELILINNAVSYTIEVCLNLIQDNSYLKSLIPFSNTYQFVNYNNIINNETAIIIYKNYIAGWNANITRICFDNLNIIKTSETTMINIRVSPNAENAYIRTILNFKEIS